MSDSTTSPRYKNNPIRSVDALSKALGIPESVLRETAVRADALYRLAKPIIKLDGSIRQPFDALPPVTFAEI